MSRVQVFWLVIFMLLCSISLTFSLTVNYMEHRFQEREKEVQSLKMSPEYLKGINQCFSSHKSQLH